MEEEGGDGKGFGGRQSIRGIFRDALARGGIMFLEVEGKVRGWMGWNLQGGVRFSMYIYTVRVCVIGWVLASCEI